MKKVLALMLALVMVMLMVAACGGGDVDDTTTTNATVDTTAGNGDATDSTTVGNNDATTAAPTTNDTTKATDETTKATTTEAPVVATPVQAVVLVPLVADGATIYSSKDENIFVTLEEAEAINIANGETITVANVTAGHYYVVETVNGTTTAVADLGAAFDYAYLNRMGVVTIWRDAENMTGGGATGKWYTCVDDNTYLFNYVNVDAANAAMGDYKLGSFGTVSITGVDDGAVNAVDNGEEVNMAEKNVRFVYATYTGDALEEATEECSSYGIQVNAFEYIKIAEDETTDGGQGTIKSLWDAYIANYGKTGGPQETAEANWKAALPARALSSAKNAYEASLTNGAAAGEVANLLNAYEKAQIVYEEFCEYYVEAVNCILWGEDPSDSALSEYFDYADEGATLDLQYYYDAETDTYVIFLGSGGPGATTNFGYVMDGVCYWQHVDFENR